MIKDTLLKILFIVVPGIAISYVSGIISWSNYSSIKITGACLYFVFVSFCIWGGCQWIHLRLRGLYKINGNFFTWISLVVTTAALYTGIAAGVFCLIWIGFTKGEFNWGAINTFVTLSVITAIIFRLVYEILYLTKERELDMKVVSQLDNELSRVEMIALRNTLDPHFIFNSLNTLSYLITKDSKKADLFNNRLAQVYKYFLLNKDKEVISADREIEFIKNYFSLIQIRHGNKLHLHIDLGKLNIKDTLVIPCALQIPIENVIKHNDFSDNFPLTIYIRAENDFLIIQNNLSPKSALADSTKLGLRNLASQYLLVFNKDIIVKKQQNTFIVKLPLIKNIKTEYV